MCHESNYELEHKNTRHVNEPYTNTQKLFHLFSSSYPIQGCRGGLEPIPGDRQGTP